MSTGYIPWLAHVAVFSSYADHLEFCPQRTGARNSLLRIVVLCFGLDCRLHGPGLKRRPVRAQNRSFLFWDLEEKKPRLSIQISLKTLHSCILDQNIFAELKVSQMKLTVYSIRRIKRFFERGGSGCSTFFMRLWTGFLLKDVDDEDRCLLW